MGGGEGGEGGEGGGGKESFCGGGGGTACDAKCIGHGYIHAHTICCVQSRK